MEHGYAFDEDGREGPVSGGTLCWRSAFQFVLLAFDDDIREGVPEIMVGLLGREVIFILVDMLGDLRLHLFEELREISLLLFRKRGVRIRVRGPVRKHEPRGVP